MLNQVSLKSFFLSLSSLLDNGDKSISNHQLRTAFIAWKIGKNYGLNLSEMNNLIIASLVHDIGVLSIEEKLEIDLSKLEEKIFHSYKGWYILQKVPEFMVIADSVKYHHTSYKKLGDKQIIAQIINISDNLERLINRDNHILEQKDRILETLTNDEHLHPEMKKIVLEIGSPERFWFDLVNENLLSHFYDVPICDKLVSKELMKSLSFLIKDIIDFKSPFTVAHSTAVMYCAYTLGAQLGYSEDDLDDLAIAGLLHDVGKLTVPSNILMKNGALSHLEKAVIMQHPYYTYRFLKEAGYSKKIYYAASCHHEGLDGNGYPFKFDTNRLSEFSKIMAVCDVFVALFEDRPYRKGLSRETIEKILGDLSGTKLDEDLVEKILKLYEPITDGLKQMSIMYKAEYEIFQKILETYITK